MTVRRFTFDLALEDPRNPDAGDVLVSARRVYRITEAVPVDSKVWGNRWRLTVHTVGTATDGRPDIMPWLEAGNRVWYSSHYRRGETPAEFFARREVPVAP